MTNSIVALDKNAHRNMRVTADNTFKHMQNQHICFLQAHELTFAALHYPCVFIKDAETGQFLLVSLLGLEPNENLFHNAKGWEAAYVPTSIRGFPFLIAAQTSSVCVDTSSERISETEGDRLFNDDGSESTYLQYVKELLSTFANQTRETKQFIKFLVEKNLLTTLSLTIQDPSKESGEVQLNGIYAVDKEKLHALPDDEFVKLKNNHYLLPIYAHILSMGAVASLVQKKNSRNS